MNSALIYLHASNISSTDALAAFQSLLTPSDCGAGLLSTPRRFQLARITPASATDEFGDTVSLDEVFELRAFDSNVELRWLHRSEGKGRAVILGESLESRLSGDWTRTSRGDLERIDGRQYLVWGTRDDRRNPPRGKRWDPAWTVLYEPQIGELAVPIPLARVPTQGRVLLQSVEYLADGDDDGNAVVIEERLIGLSGLVETAADPEVEPA